MKRTPLQRSPLRRKAMKKRRTGPTALEVEWRAEHECCAACGFQAGQFGGWLELHHILKHGTPQEPGQKPGRLNDKRNFIRLCKQTDGPRCHDLAEGDSRIPMDGGGYWPVLTLGMVLTLKAESDPDNFDLDWLRAANRGYLPEPEPVPDELRRRT